MAGDLFLAMGNNCISIAITIVDNNGNSIAINYSSMNMYNRTLLTCILALMVVTVSCDNNSSGTEEGNENPAVVEGRVDNLSSSAATGDTAQAKIKQVEGAIVQAMRVNAQGNLQPLGEDTTQTNAEGSYTLEITAPDLADVSDRVIITAEQDGQMAKTFVTAMVEPGGTSRAQPIGYESSAEASVFQELLAQGETNQVTNADIEAVVTGPVAVDMETDTALVSDVTAAVVAYEQAKREYYNSQDTDVSQGQWEDINEIEVDAQIELENRLSTSTEAGVSGASDAFLEAYAQAEIEGGVNATAAAKSSEVASSVLVNQLTALSDTAQMDVQKRMAYIKTFPLAAAVIEQLEGLEVSEAGVDNVEQAAITARTEIRALEGEVTEEDIQSIFANFREVVVTVLGNEEGLNAELFVAVNSGINEAGGPKASLESALEGNADVVSVMDAYNRFYNSVESSVEDTFSDADQAGLAAYYTQLLILLNAPA